MRFLRAVLKKEKKKAPDVSEFLARIKQEFKKKGLSVDVLLGGSLAKDTFLAVHDIDVFVLFKDKPDSCVLENVLKKINKKVQRIHGSRDYFHVHYKRLVFEVVPILKISHPRKAQNTPDVSPFHVSWVKRHLKKPDEVRLAKLFFQAQGVYGAESYIQGFSGYVLEILTAHYGSFLKLVRAASQWKPKEVIDTAKQYRSNSQVMRLMNDSKLDSPVIIVDPVDKKRNAAAALSTEKWVRLVSACKAFLQNPSESFFKHTPFRPRGFVSACKRRGTTPYILSFVELSHEIHREDLSFSKTRKSFMFIRNKLRQADFEVYEHGIDWDKRLMWFEVLEPLPRTKRVMGPMVWASDKNILAFQVKHSKWTINGTHYVAFQKRKHTEAKLLLKQLLKDSYVAEKIKKIKIV